MQNDELYDEVPRSILPTILDGLNVVVRDGICESLKACEGVDPEAGRKCRSGEASSAEG